MDNLDVLVGRFFYCKLTQEVFKVTGHDGGIMSVVWVDSGEIGGFPWNAHNFGEVSSAHPDNEELERVHREICDRCPSVDHRTIVLS